MKITSLILTLLAIGVCLMSFSFFKRDYADIACDIRNKTAKELAKKYHMSVVGSGGGFFESVNRISVSFDINRILSKEEARCMIIDCVETFLKAFNENEKIRPYLSNYPFTPANLKIAIFTCTSSRGSVYYPDFYVVSSSDGKVVSFYTQNQKGFDFPSIDEPYLEVVAKVKQSGQCPISSN